MSFSTRLRVTSQLVRKLRAH